MKNLAGFVFGILVLASCQKGELASEFTGNQTTYALQQASAYPINGMVTFKERKDGTVTAVVTLTGMNLTPGATYPVHLHLGDVSTPLASVAALLSPVNGKTSQSVTNLSILADESPVTYQKIIKLNACMKIHLSDVGAESNIILAAGNIGSAVAQPIAGGRIGVSVCQSK